MADAHLLVAARHLLTLTYSLDFLNVKLAPVTRLDGTT